MALRGGRGDYRGVGGEPYLLQDRFFLSTRGSVSFLCFFLFFARKQTESKLQANSKQTESKRKANSKQTGSKKKAKSKHPVITPRACFFFAYVLVIADCR